jgi:hypothetical protein
MNLSAESLLNMACQDKAYEVITYCQTKNVECKLAVYTAAKNDDKDILNILVSSTTTKDIHEFLVMGACEGGHKDLIMRELLIHAKKNFPFPILLALCICIKERHEDIFDFLTNYYGPNFDDKMKECCLIEAISTHQHSIVEKLLPYFSPHGSCPLPWSEVLSAACRNSNLKWFTYFISLADSICYTLIKSAVKCYCDAKPESPEETTCFDIFVVLVTTFLTRGLHMSLKIPKFWNSDMDFDEYLYDTLWDHKALPLICYMLNHTDLIPPDDLWLDNNAIGWLLNRNCSFFEDHEDYSDDHKEDREKRIKKINECLLMVLPQDVVNLLCKHIGYEPSDWQKGKFIRPDDCFY